MEVRMLRVGAIQTNCYIVSSKKGNAALIDPGSSAEMILKECENLNLKIKKLIFTHGHFDHIMAASEIIRATNAESYLHEADNELLLKPQLLPGVLEFCEEEGYIPAAADHLFNDGDSIALDEIEFNVLHTPGHSKGSSVLIADNIIFSGDTLFKNGIGRVDLYGGDLIEIMNSVRRIAGLEGDYKVLPGHGDPTTLAEERVGNPYMGTDYDDIF